MALSIRGIWIIKEEEILLSRRFPTVEQRVFHLYGQKYYHLPADNEFLTLFLAELRNSKATLGTPTVFSLKNNTIWPFTYVKRNDIYFACSIVIEGFGTTTTISSPLTELPQITGAISLLEDIAHFTSKIFTPENKLASMGEIQSYLSKMLPFGKCVDTNFNNISSMIRQGFPIATEPLVLKRPAWKPYFHKGKQRMEFLIQEKIQCVQYDREDVADIISGSGSLLAKADLENLPEVTLLLQTSNAPTRGKIGGLAFDSCVQTSDGSSVSSKSSMKSLVQKLVFSPPLDQFLLCKYTVENMTEIPIRAFYQMKEVSKKEIKLLVQLKLNEKYPNSFQYCEMELPFPNRGNIVHIDISPTAGAVTIATNRKGLKWNIGQKITSKNLEVSLPATIYFDEKVELEDPFLVGENAYVQMRFKILGDSLSSLVIDNNGVTLFPVPPNKSQPSITVEREIIAEDYIIWNSLGQARVTMNT